MAIFDRDPGIEQTPRLESVLPEKIRSGIARGQLPVIRARNIQMGIQEHCRYVEPAIYEKKVRAPRGATKRKSRRLFRNATRESDKKDSVVDITFQQVRGYLYITDKRVVFSAGPDSWERLVSELLSVKPYLNCVKLQFGKDSYKVFVPDGALAQGLLIQLRDRPVRTGWPEEGIDK